MSERPSLPSELFRMVIKMIVGGILVIGLVSCGVGAIAGAAGGSGGKKKATDGPVSAHLYGEEDSENAIMRVNVIGPILSHNNSSDDGFFSQIASFTYGYDVKEQLLEAAKNDDVKAIMLYVQTPGGSIIGSDAIHDGVKAVQDAGKPVIAYIDSISASGGVWSTAGADKIFADYGSVIGSVGVNFGNWLYFDDPVALDGGLFGNGVDTRGGIKARFIGAGLGKDLGNPWRDMTDREESLLNASAQVYYDHFVDHLVENRPIDRQRLVEEYGAMIFADELAKERGYIDDMKTYQETLAFIAGEIGAEGDDWKLIAPPAEEKTPFEQLFGAYLTASKGDEIRMQQRASACAELTGRPMVMTANAFVSLCRQ